MTLHYVKRHDFGLMSLSVKNKQAQDNCKHRTRGFIHRLTTQRKNCANKATN